MFFASIETQAGQLSDRTDTQAHYIALCHQGSPAQFFSLPDAGGNARTFRFAFQHDAREFLRRCHAHGIVEEMEIFSTNAKFGIKNEIVFDNLRDAMAFRDECVMRSMTKDN